MPEREAFRVMSRIMDKEKYPCPVSLPTISKIDSAEGLENVVVQCARGVLKMSEEEIFSLFWGTFDDDGKNILGTQSRDCGIIFCERANCACVEELFDCRPAFRKTGRFSVYMEENTLYSFYGR